MNGRDPLLDLLGEQWPSLVFVPTVLALVVVLVLVTRWWDRRDEARAAEEGARRADALAGPGTARAATAPPRAAGNRSRRSWRRRTRCTCSWHDIRTEPAVSVAGPGAGTVQR